MTDLEKLKKIITDSGIPITKIADKSGMKRETIYNRFNGIGEFTASEISGLALALNLTKEERDEIFFANKVECNSTI